MDEHDLLGGSNIDSSDAEWARYELGVSTTYTFEIGWSTEASADMAFIAVGRRRSSARRRRLGSLRAR